MKYAYAAIRETKLQNGLHDTLNWNRMWNLQVPLKVKHHIWRATRNILPTKDQLLSKRVQVLSFCPVCNLEVETVHHYLLSCPFTKLCWNHANINITADIQSSFKDWFAHVLQHYDSAMLQDIVMICWAIWRNRIAIVWRQQGVDHSELCKSAKLYLSQWRNAQDKSFNISLGFMTEEDDHEH